MPAATMMMGVVGSAGRWKQGFVGRRARATMSPRERSARWLDATPRWGGALAGSSTGWWLATTEKVREAWLAWWVGEEEME